MNNFDENKKNELNSEPNAVYEYQSTENGTERPIVVEAYSYTNYGAGQEAEYEDRGGKTKKKKSRGAKIAAVSILVVAGIVLSNIFTAFMLPRFWKNGGIQSDKYPQYPNIETGESNPTPDSNNVEGSVNITKSPSDKVNVVEGEVGEKNMSVAQIAALVADSVVEITTSSVQYDIFYGQRVVSGAGSGVIFGRNEDDGNEYYIVTNHHVIDNSEKIYARLRDGSEYECTFIASDVISDIGILKIETDAELTVAELGDSDSLVVGEEIVAIGNPLGRLGGTVTNGIISALERKVNIDGLEMTLLQHNAAISPGNSGGGIFDTCGYLVGIVNAKSSASSAEGIGFAIPINHAYSIIVDLLTYGCVMGRAELPFETQEYTSSSVFGSTSTYVVVTSLSDDYDIEYNDIVYSIDDVRVSDMNSMISLLSKYKAGDTVLLKVARTVGREVRLYSYEVTLMASEPREDVS